MSASTSASSIAATELPELVTLTFEHRPKRYPDQECVEWDNLTVERRPDSWGVYEFYPWGIPSYSSHQRFEEYGRYGNPAEAWVQMLKFYDHDSALVFVGPGESPAVLVSPKFEPELWTVYRVDDQGQCIETGRFVHRLSVLSAVKSIIADGGCPVAVSPYLLPDREWNAVHVLASSELPAMASSSDSEVVREAIG